jgi:hypothetical protein
MIFERDSICKQTKWYNLDLILYNKLVNLRNKHEERWMYLKDIDLNYIYTLIKNLNEIELINKQMNIFITNISKNIKYKTELRNQLFICFFIFRIEMFTSFLFRSF